MYNGSTLVSEWLGLKAVFSFWYYWLAPKPVHNGSDSRLMAEQWWNFENRILRLGGKKDGLWDVW